MLYTGTGRGGGGTWGQQNVGGGIGGRGRKLCCFYQLNKGKKGGALVIGMRHT